MRSEFEQWRDEINGVRPSLTARCLAQVPSLLVSVAFVWLVMTLTGFLP
jgi:hypothetical protein